VQRHANDWVVSPVNEWLVEKASSIHGRGLFARRAIPAHTCVIDYVGETITREESARRCAEENVYIFSLNEQFDLDGNVSWNPARFINHSCAPNCEAELDEEARCIRIQTLRDIQPHEEITFNYGYDLEDYQDHPCACGAPTCVGYIVAEELSETVKRRAQLRREVEAALKLAGSSPAAQPT
jgi:hypothetical protein